jgi:hypothetical protein
MRGDNSFVAHVEVTILVSVCGGPHSDDPNQTSSSTDYKIYFGVAGTNK